MDCLTARRISPKRDSRDAPDHPSVMRYRSMRVVARIIYVVAAAFARTFIAGLLALAVWLALMR